MSRSIGQIRSNDVTIVGDSLQISGGSNEFLWDSTEDGQTLAVLDKNNREYTIVFEDNEEAIDGNLYSFIEDATGAVANNDIYNQITTDGTINVWEKWGCTDEAALNYNENALNDDGSCEYEEEEEVIRGCMDETALNYNPDATSNEGFDCIYEEETDIIEESTETETEDVYEGVSNVQPITSGYTDSGAITTATQIPTLLGNSFTNLDSKLRAYFELVEEVQYKLDDTKKDLDTTLELCKNDEGLPEACATAEALADYVTELEDKLDEMTTPDAALTALLTELNDGTIGDYNFQNVGDVTDKIDSLEAEIAALQDAADADAATIVNNEALIADLNAELDALAGQISDAGLTDLDALLEAYSTSTALNAQLESFALQTMTILGSTFSAETLNDLNNFTAELTLDEAMSADFTSALNTYVQNAESAAITANQVVDSLGATITQTDYETLVSQFGTLNNTVSDLGDQITALQSDIDATIAAADGVTGEESSTALSAVTSLLDAQQIAVDAYEATISALEGSINSAIGSLETLFGFEIDTENLTLDTALLDAISQTSTLISQYLSDISAAIEVSEGANIGVAIGELITAYNLANDGYTLESQNAAVQAALDNLDQAISQDPEASGSTEADLLVDIAIMHQEISELEIENATLQSGLGAGSQDIADLQATIAQLQANNAILQSDIAAYVDEIAQINTALGGVQAEIEQFDALAEVLGTELNSLSNYLARYGYQPTDFSVDEASSMFYDQDADNLTAVESQELLDGITPLSWDASASTPTEFGEFAGGNGRTNMWSNFCAERGGVSIMPLLDWGIEMKNFYDNAVNGNNTNNMRHQTLSAAGQSVSDRECNTLPDLTTVNTGANMTVFINSTVSKILSGAIIDPSVRIYAVTREGKVVGAGGSTSKEQAFPIWGKDTTVEDTPDIPSPTMDVQIVDPTLKPTDAYKPDYSNKPNGQVPFGAEEGETVFFRVLYRNKIMKIMTNNPQNVNGELVTKYYTNGIFNFDEQYSYKLEELCYIDYLAGSDTLPEPPSTMSIWAKAALIVGGVYVLNKLLKK